MSRRAAIDALIRQLKYRPADERNTLCVALGKAMHSTLPIDLMMRPAQVRRWHNAEMEIGGRTSSHPILSTLDEEEARAEIVGGRRRLEEITGAPVTLFAYPSDKPGEDCGTRDAKLVREGSFVAAVSTVRGVARRTSDPFQLPRFGPWHREP
jgi:peptidoglycan/xylan/chitin deacetylase (PgdA/CDA1 family)